jgi:hypothetical protein
MKTPEEWASRVVDDLLQYGHQLTWENKRNLIAAAVGLAVDAEREACAAVADTTNCRCLGGAIGINSLCEAHDAARAIRARATTQPEAKL